MPQSLAKVTKKIVRKKGKATGLHEKSRDAAKLRKASAREERVQRANAAKGRTEERYVHRIAYFQAALRELESGREVGEISALARDAANTAGEEDTGDTEQPSAEDRMTTDGTSPSSSADDPKFAASTIHSLINAYITSLSSLHPSNKSYDTNPELPFKPFRPAARTAAESKALERQKLAKREYLSGFWCPELRNAQARAQLREWRGDWAGFNTLTFIRVNATGNIKDSTFPPRGGV